MTKGELIHKYIENSTRLRFEDPGALQNFSLQEYYPEDIRPYIEVFDKSILRLNGKCRIFCYLGTETLEKYLW